MSLLTLCTPDDTDRLVPMITACQRAHGTAQQPEDRLRAALDMVFSGEVQAAIWLIGPRRAPVGFISVTFGFALDLAGRDARIDAFYIREAVRGRGMGSQVLQELGTALPAMGVAALHADLDRDAPDGDGLYRRSHFAPQDGTRRLTRRF